MTWIKTLSVTMRSTCGDANQLMNWRGCRGHDIKAASIHWRD
jgi:hypothetical protein